MHEREHAERPGPGPGRGCVDWGDAMADDARAAGQEPDARLDGILRRSASRVPDRTALVGVGGSWTHAELDAEVDLVARGLAASGVLLGDRILLQLADGAAFLIAGCAVVRAGAVPVHAMPGHRLMELAHLAAGSGARGLVLAERVGRDDGRDLAAGVRAACPGLDLVILHGSRRVDGALTGEEVRDRGRTPEGAVAAPGSRLDPIAPDGAPRLGLLLHSGGTTGLPKLIPRHHAEYSYNAGAAARASGVGPDAVLLAVLPVAFNFTLACPGALGVLDAGGTVVIAPDPDPATAFALVARERVTPVALTPTLARAWIDEAAHATADLSSLRVVQVGGARLDDVTACALEPALGATLQQVYGMAEGRVCMTRLGDPPELRWSTLGRPISPDDLIRLRAADGSLAADGEAGVLETRGPCTLRGYHAAPDADATAFTPDGFYRTGDVVRRLPSGHLVVTGRAKDQVNRGGEKYAAAEVERYLLALPSVRAAAVLPVPDPDLGERAVAVIACAGPAPDRRAVVAHLRSLGVAAYKHPDREGRAARAAAHRRGQDRQRRGRGAARRGRAPRGRRGHPCLTRSSPPGPSWRRSAVPPASTRCTRPRRAPWPGRCRRVGASSPPPGPARAPPSPRSSRRPRAGAAPPGPRPTPPARRPSRSRRAGAAIPSGRAAWSAASRTARGTGPPSSRASTRCAPSGSTPSRTRPCPGRPGTSSASRASCIRIRRSAPASTRTACSSAPRSPWARRTSPATASGSASRTST